MKKTPTTAELNPVSAPAEQHFTCDADGTCTPTGEVYADWNPLEETLDDRLQRREESVRADVARDERRRNEVTADLLAFTLGNAHETGKPVVTELDDAPWVHGPFTEATGEVYDWNPLKEMLDARLHGPFTEG